jgi:hypothetical protein
MTAPGCSPNCREAHDRSDTVARELDRCWWLGIVFVAAACALAYPAYTVTRLFWIPAALAAWFGTYQTIYSKGCSSCGAPREDGAAAPTLDAVQRATRRRMAHQFLVAAIVLAAISAWFLPLLWPLTAMRSWVGSRRRSMSPCGPDTWAAPRSVPFPVGWWDTLSLRDALLLSGEMHARDDSPRRSA